MNESKKELLGEKIRRLRKSAKKSQKDLGEALGKSYAAVSDIERGKTELTVKDLKKISEFLEVPISELIPDEPKISGTFVQSRDNKDSTIDERIELENAENEFKKMARELAEKKRKQS